MGHALLLDEVAGNSPLPIFVEHGNHSFHCGWFVFKVGVVLDHDVFTFRRIGQCLGVRSALELPRQNLALRGAIGRQKALPLVFGHGGLERLGRFIPTLRVLSGVDDGQSGVRGLLRELFRFLLGLSGCRGAQQQSK